MMRERLPLLSHASDDTVVARGPDGIKTRSDFVSDVSHLAAALPPGGHVLNLCADRYRFAVALAACLLAEKVSLLPSSHTPETLRQLREDCPDLFCISDQPEPELALPLFRYPELPPAADLPVPEIPVERLMARVFTSGSTGRPQPHPKTWGKLVLNGRAEAHNLGLLDAPGCIVGTVPPQHMYGFESTLLQALFSGSSFWRGRPFYPADIVAALEAVPAPRMLVTTPFHLHTLLESGLALPALSLILSATAPLAPELAQAAEARFEAPLYEIYGCTETGQIASRRTTAGPAWQLFDDIRLRGRDEDTWAEGGHIEARVRLGDVIEPLEGGRFLLHGRSADLVNIAGKRASIAYLNQQLKAVPGVVDGAFLLPDGADAHGVQRLAACVVAPGLARATLLAALRERIDAVFLPRPLVLVDGLPRNATGKLTRTTLLELLAAHRPGGAQ